MMALACNSASWDGAGAAVCADTRTLADSLIHLFLPVDRALECDVSVWNMDGRGRSLSCHAPGAPPPPAAAAACAARLNGSRV
jgi:hypothetical protein